MNLQYSLIRRLGGLHNLSGGVVEENNLSLTHNGTPTAVSSSPQTCHYSYIDQAILAPLTAWWRGTPLYCSAVGSLDTGTTFKFYCFAVALKPLLCECPRVGRAPSLPYTAFVGWHLPVTWLIYRSPGRHTTAGQHIGAGWGPCAKSSASFVPEHHENEHRWQAYCKKQSCSWQADSRSTFCGARRFITVLTTARHCFASPSRCIQFTLTLVSLKIQFNAILIWFIPLRWWWR